MNCNLEENFKRALELCETPLSHDGMIELLKNGNAVEKQIVSLNLDKITSTSEAEIFISNLTRCDGKIREAVASRLSEFLASTTGKYFLEFDAVFAESTIDINANISRMVIDALSNFAENENFAQKYSERLVKFIDEAFEEISKIKLRDKKYILNKQLFKIYWALEGLQLYYKYIDEDILYDILHRVLEQKEYTVREKAAQILIKISPIEKFSPLLKIAAVDENFYIRRAMEKVRG